MVNKINIKLLLLYCLFCCSSLTYGQERSSFFNPGKTVFNPTRTFGFQGYTGAITPAKPAVPAGKSITADDSIPIRLTQAETIYESQLPQLPQSPLTGSPLDEYYPTYFDNTTTIMPGTAEYSNVPPGGTEDRLGGFVLFPRPARNSLIQGVSLDLSYGADSGSNRSGFYRAMGAVTFGFPAPTTQSPLLVTPFFDWVQYNTPDNLRERLPEKLNLYAPGFNAEYFLPLNDVLLLNLNARFQWTTDFKAKGADPLRITGYGVVIWKVREDTRLILGAAYTDVSTYKVLPVAGILWKPSENCFVEAYFPAPRVSWKLPESCSVPGKAPYWAYLGGEFEGNSWLVRGTEPTPAGETDATYRINYYDYRLFAGLERRSLDDWNWAVEGGLLFERKFECQSVLSSTPYQQKTTPEPTGFVRFKVRY